MEFFDKFHAFCFGFLVLLIVITLPYTINHGDFFQNESELIIVDTINVQDYGMMNGANVLKAALEKLQ